MEPNALRASPTRWVLLLAVVLIALAAAVGFACGDDGDSRPTSRPSEERESTGDREERGDDEEEDRDSSGSQTSRTSTERLSVQDLESVPNLPFPRVVMVDVKALLSGDVPRQVASVYGVREAWLALTEALGSSEDTPIDMSMEELETFIFMEGQVAAFTIQGDYSLEAVRNSLIASGDGERIEGGDVELEVWQFTDLYDTQTVVFSQNQVYGIDRDWDESREFISRLAQGDMLLGESDNPIVRLTDRVGTGWLVVAISDWCVSFVFAVDECLGMAFAASTESETSVAATFAFLFESSESATEVHREVEERREKEFSEFSLSIDNNWISQVDADGEFLVFEASLPVEDAAQLFRRLITELEHPDP